MKEQFQLFLSTLLKVDPSLLLYKYICRENSSFINSASKIPDTPSKFQTYFYGKCRPDSKGIIVWPLIKVGVSIDPEVFITDAKCLLEDLEMTIFMKDLQSEETEVLGYFLFSHSRQCRARLRIMIEGELKKMGIKDIISVRWQKIMQTKKDQGTQAPKAYHVEVIKGCGVRVTDAIQHIYSSRRNKYPHSEKMRFIPYNRDVQHSSAADRNLKIINKQLWFLGITTHASSFEISLLDDVHDDIGQSLRDLIMGMSHSSGEQLFNTVDWNWNRTAVVFVFPEAYEQEARDRIADLGSYLSHHIGEEVLLRYFTPEAAKRASRAPWDSKLGRAISEDDKEFDQILQDCDDIDWLKPKSANKSVKVTFQQAPKTKKFFHFSPTDDSSIPTLGKTSVTTDVNSNGDSSAVESSNGDTAVSDNDSLTNDDGDAQTVATLATQFEEFKDGMEKKFDLICDLLQTAKTDQGGVSCSVATRQVVPDSGKDEGEGPR